MLVGHYAAGFLGKQVARRVPLAALMAAVMLPDLLSFPLQLVGIEHAGLTPGYPRFFPLNAYDDAITHSLLMDAIWGVVVGVAYFLWRADTRGAVVLTAAVLSHWVFDVITHRPDMTLAPGVEWKVGLVLYDSIPATLVVEGALWLIAVGTYLRATRPIARLGRVYLWLLVVPLTLWFVATPLAPQPPAGDFSSAAIVTFLAIHLAMVALAYGADRYRAMGDAAPEAVIRADGVIDGRSRSERAF